MTGKNICVVEMFFETGYVGSRSSIADGEYGPYR